MPDSEEEQRLLEVPQQSADPACRRRHRNAGLRLFLLAPGAQSEEGDLWQRTLQHTACWPDSHRLLAETNVTGFDLH